MGTCSDIRSGSVDRQCDLFVGTRRWAAATVIRLSGEIVVLTARHAVDDVESASLFVKVAGAVHPASVAAHGDRLDWAVLRVPSLLHCERALSMGSATRAGAVVMRRNGRVYHGRITAFRPVARFVGRHGETVDCPDLFEVRMDEPPPTKCSGAPIVCAHSGAAVGMVVGGNRGQSVQTTLLCHLMTSVLDDIMKVTPPSRGRAPSF